MCAGFDLGARRLAHAVYAVGLAADEVAVAARHRDHPPGGLDRRSRDHATIDRLGQLDDDVVRRPTVANGGDARAQRQLGVEDAANGRDRNAVIADLLEEVGHAVVAEVDMAIDKSRQQRAAAAVEDAAGLERRRQRGRTYPCDALVLDYDRAAP